MFKGFCAWLKSLNKPKPRSRRLMPTEHEIINFLAAKNIATCEEIIVRQGMQHARGFIYSYLDDLERDQWIQRYYDSDRANVVYVLTDAAREYIEEGR